MLTTLVIILLLGVAHPTEPSKDAEDVSGPVVVQNRPQANPETKNSTGEKDPTLKAIVKEVAKEVDSALIKVSWIQIWHHVRGFSSPHNDM